MKTPLAAIFALLTALSSSALAGAIYPIDRASILAGSRFDLKVEFDAVSAERDVRIAINGVDYATALGGKPVFIEKEDGQPHDPAMLNAPHVPFMTEFLRRLCTIAKT